MILLTVGTQLPFDRLVRAIDAWCAEQGTETVFGQIADPGAGGYRPAHFEWASFVDPERFDALFAEARVIVGHAGMGTIIGGLTAGKPVVIMPRRAALGEHRNDHQWATAMQFRDRALLHVATDETELPAAIEAALAAAPEAQGAARTPGHAEEGLIAALSAFIHRGELPDAADVSADRPAADPTSQETGSTRHADS